MTPGDQLPNFPQYDPPKPPVFADKKQAAPLLKVLRKGLTRKLPKTRSMKMAPIKPRKKTRVL